MKVAIIAEWVDPWRGGAETSTLQFIHRLLDLGVHVNLYTRSRPSPIPGLDVVVINGNAVSRAGAGRVFVKHTEEAIGRQAHDVIHAITLCRGTDVYQPRGGLIAESIARNLALRAGVAGRSVKRMANSLNLKQQYQLRLERAVLRDPRGPLIAAISDYVARQVQQHYHLPNERIVSIFNAVEADTASPAQRAADRAAIRREFGVATDDLLVLTVAHNFRLKGVVHWMRAHQALVQRGHRDIRSLVIGKGDTPSWHRRAARLGISRYLQFVGPSDRVRNFYHAADVLVHPTYYDPCSRVVMEGLVSGVAVVTTRWDGAAEKVIDGTNGFVLEEPSDIARLADRVEQLKDPALRRSFAQRGAALTPELSMERHARQMVNLYERIAASRQSGPRRLVVPSGETR